MSHYEIYALFLKIETLYQDFVCLAAVISILAGGALSFEEFRNSKSALLQSSEGHLCSAVATAVFSGVMTLILKFHSQSFAGITSVGRLIVWLPIILLELSMAQFLAGLGYWYCSRSSEEASCGIVIYIISLLITWIALSAWIFWRWSVRGSLNCFRDLWDCGTSTQSLCVFLTRVLRAIVNTYPRGCCFV